MNRCGILSSTAVTTKKKEKKKTANISSETKNKQEKSNLNRAVLLNFSPIFIFRSIFRSGGYDAEPIGHHAGLRCAVPAHQRVSV